MSWQAYVDDHLMCQLPGGGQLAHAAIWGQDSGVWAQDAGFPAVTPEEIAVLVAGFNDPAQLAQVRLLSARFGLATGVGRTLYLASYRQQQRTAHHWTQQPFSYLACFEPVLVLLASG